MWGESTGQRTKGKWYRGVFARVWSLPFPRLFSHTLTIGVFYSMRQKTTP